MDDVSHLPAQVNNLLRESPGEDYRLNLAMV